MSVMEQNGRRSPTPAMSVFGGEADIEAAVPDFR
jgi:hypothetical protein